MALSVYAIGANGKPVWEPLTNVNLPEGTKILVVARTWRVEAVTIGTVDEEGGLSWQTEDRVGYMEFREGRWVSDAKTYNRKRMEASLRKANRSVR
jgi:hypothetical protein